MKISISLFFTLLCVSLALAQQPRVASLSQHSGYAEGIIEISGSGFSSTTSQNVVWFGASRGRVISATENILEVEVPPGTSSSAVSVTNLQSGLTGYSSIKFHIAFPGDANATSNTSTPFVFSVPRELFEVVAGDFDGDGLNDIAVAQSDDVSTEVTLMRNTTVNGVVTFASTTFFITKPTLGATTGDIDGDGKLDLVFTRTGTTKNQIYALRNTSSVGSISFATAKSYYLTPGDIARSVRIRDLDLDGKPEVIVTNTASNVISIFKNTSTPGNLSLEFTPVEVTVSDAGSTSGLVVEDLNKDGKPDVAVNQFASSDVFVLPNTSSGGVLSFGDVITLSVNGNLLGLACGDINEDNKPDLLVTDIISNKVSILVNESNDNIAFSAPQEFTTGSQPWSIGLLDFSGNNKLDIIATSVNGNSYTFFLNKSNGGALNLETFSIPQTLRSRNIDAADFSGDGKPDFVASAENVGATSYSVVVVRNDVCTSPFLLTEPSVAICTGQTHTMEVVPSPGTTFIWRKDGVEVANGPENTYTTSVPGSFTVEAQSGPGCSVVSDPILVNATSGTIPTDPVANNNGPVCLGSSLTLSTQSIAGAQYIWSGPNGFTSTDQNPVIDNIRSDQAGFYSVKAIISPCESAESRTLVEVITPPDFTIAVSGPTRFCESETTTLAVASTTDFTYQWTLNGSNIAGATSNTLVATEAGVYQVMLDGVSSSCTLSSDTKELSVFPAPTPNFTFEGNKCALSEISFTNTSVTETDQVATYSWDFGDGSVPKTTENPTHEFSTDGTYPVTLTVGYEGRSCTNTITQDILIDQPTPFDFVVDGGTTIFCERDSLLIEIPGTYSAYQWSNGSTSSSTYIKNAGTVTASATNANGCSFTNSIDVSTNPAPDVTITADATNVLPGGSAQLEASGADSYSWEPAATLSNANIANPVATPTETTLYTAYGTLLTTGCIGIGTITIELQDTGDQLPVTAPVMFSPNADNTNDTWIIENMGAFPDCKVTVFNRNGKVVHEVRPYVDWDGRDVDGTMLEEGAYYFVISCDDGKSKTGSVSIIY